MTPSPLTAYLAAVEARTEATKDDHNIPPLVNAAAEMSMLAHARTDLPRLVRLLRVATEALGKVMSVTDDPCRGNIVEDPELLWGAISDSYSAAAEALATLDRLATEEENT